MTEAEIAYIQKRYQSADHPEVCAMVKDLLAHIDAQYEKWQTAEHELLDAENRIDALAAEVERLKAELDAARWKAETNKELAFAARDSSTHHLLECDSLRDLVEQRDSLLREAVNLIREYCETHVHRGYDTADCGQCVRADAFLEKAARV